ncbi:MAG: hypothetical protein EA352_09955 [Gemmatimonadales bacterium]|nr:MAG: hypothetical protein EA352_09955 [Gemmatimonadales bacterium]
MAVRHRSCRALRRLLPAALVLLLSGCAALEALAALSQVRFDFDRISSVHLVGVNMMEVREPSDLSALDALRLGRAIRDREAPLQLVVDLAGENPEDNPEARLTALDWTFFLEEQETVRGGLPSALSLPPGERTIIPLTVEFDLVAFVDDSLRDVINLTAALAGLTEDRPDVRLEAIPSVDTRAGPIQYPRPLVLRP